MGLTFKAVAAAGIMLPCLAIGHAVEAKTPGHEYCFHGTCHTVKSLDETRRLIGVTTKMKASFYDDPKKDRYNPSNITSSGEYFRSDRPDNAASPIYPDGTKLLVWHPASQKTLLIRVNNAGPYWGDRKLDLSRAAAEKFGFTRSGVATVHVKVLEAPTKADATYKHGRNYPAVKGYVGQFASIDAAAADIGGGASTTRLAINVAPATPAIVPSTPLAAVTTVMLGEALTAPTVLARAELPSQPKLKPIKLTMLDLRLASNVEQEVRKFRVAQRISR